MLKVGIVGLPNVGKSTLFNAILKREQALSANYPFATIEPNHGIVDVPDERIDTLAKMHNSEKKIYSTIEFVDIAGLVEGASKGEGLGNKFLANIREVDLILHVVRNFKDENIIREHSKNPETDIKIINLELIFKDIEAIDKKLADKKKINKEEEIILLKYKAHLEEENFAYTLKDKIDDAKYLEFIKPLHLLTDKDTLFVYNSDIEDLNKKVANIVYINAKLEQELTAFEEDEDRLEMLSEYGIKESGLDKIIKKCFSRLGLISYLTAGKVETRAWEIKLNTTAQKAAGKIHTDFEKNFIKAEVVNYKDFIKYGSKVKAKEAGKLKLEGKEYIVKDGDIIEFRVNA